MMTFPWTRRPDVQLHGEIDQEVDGRWLVEVVELPGVMSYGATREEAVQRATALALRVIADRLEHGEKVFPEPDSIKLDLVLQHA